MEYNSQRSPLLLREYGRQVQKMVEHAITIADKETRNAAARSIINYMGQMYPHLRDVADFKHKLWVHLFIMANYELDVDCPYPISKEKAPVPPQKISYPTYKIRYKVYGNIVEKCIQNAKDLTDSELQKQALATIIPLMRRSYQTWNQESIPDEILIKHIKELSDGGLVVDNQFLSSQPNNSYSSNNPRNNYKGKTNNKQKFQSKYKTNTTPTSNYTKK